MTLLSEDIIDQGRAKFNMMYHVLDEYRVGELVFKIVPHWCGTGASIFGFIGVDFIHLDFI